MPRLHVTSFFSEATPLAPRFRACGRLCGCGLALVVVFALVLSGCTQDPIERSIERLESLVLLLETHKHEPDTLLAELEAFADAHEGEWEQERAEVDAMDEDARNRLLARHERELHDVIGRLYAVSREILVRLESAPEDRARFVQLLGEIGASGPSAD